jgi:hypothetical protein
MKVELPYTKDSFDADAQTRFLLAVASSVETPVGNLYIKSVVERTSSRRVLRKLLAVSVEVDFAIRVPDAAAQAAMIANEGLTAGRLNAELAKQVFPFLRTWHVWSACLVCLLSLRCVGESQQHACVCMFCVCSSIQQGGPVLRPTGAPRRAGAHAAGGTGGTGASRVLCCSSRGPGEGPVRRVFCQFELCHASTTLKARMGENPFVVARRALSRDPCNAMRSASPIRVH